MKLPFGITLSRANAASAVEVLNNVAQESKGLSVNSQGLLTKSDDVVETDPTAGGQDIDAIIGRLNAMYETFSGVVVTPESCMQSPTVQSIVQAISKRISTLPVQVMRKTEDSKGRTLKVPLPNHPVAKLLKYPNDWQTDVSYWLDASSALIRYGNFYTFKARGKTGPIRRLIPLFPGNVEPVSDSEWNVKFRYYGKKGEYIEYDPSQIHFVRGGSRDFLKGNSPVNDARESIALEIAAEKFGGTFFGNGAMPFLVFKFMQGIKGFKNVADERRFIDDFQSAYGSRGRMKAMSLPAGMEIEDPIKVENDKNQFLDTRKYQRTVIAGAFGVPPHFVGDLTSGTFNNVEQQSLDFITNVVLPVARMFEAAMEKDLLTDDDYNSGVIIRFNLEGALRGDFKSRQDGLKIQRDEGIISANEWRERENMNPISEEDGGDNYIYPMNYAIAGKEPPVPDPNAPKPTDPNAPKPNDSTQGKPANE